jgi:hypothetical protein
LIALRCGLIRARRISSSGWPPREEVRRVVASDGWMADEGIVHRAFGGLNVSGR